MRRTNLLALALFAVVSFCVAAAPVIAGSPCAKGQFLIDDFNEWQKALSGTSGSNRIRPMSSNEWQTYMLSWQQNLKHGAPYPENTFIPAQLSV